MVSSLVFSTQRPSLCSLRQGSRSAPARSRSLRLRAVARLVLTPTGDGTTEHLDDQVAVPEAIVLKDGLFELGRADGADIVVPIPTVSTRHAMLRVREADGAILVTDLGSTNGTFVDGQELTPMEAAPLALGSEVVFGDKYLAAFRLEVAPEAAADPYAADPLEDARVNEFCDENPAEPECRVYDE